MKVITIIILFLFINSCENKKDKIISTFSSINGTKWYSYPIDNDHSFYPYQVHEFFPDGKMKVYINNKTTKKLDLIPKNNLWNTEKWFVINDSTVSISSVLNPKSGYYHKTNRKILFMNKDSIILQGYRDGNYKGVLILTRYQK